MNPLITDKSIMGELKSLRKEHHESINGIVNKIVEGIEEKIIDGFVKTNYDRTQAIENRINHFENKILNILLRTEEMVRKSANSINVIVRLIAGAQKMNRDYLSKILIEAGALTDNMRSFTTDVNLEETSRDRDGFNLHLVRSNLLDLLKFTNTLSGENVNADGWHSSFAHFNPINYNVPSTSETHSTISQTSPVQYVNKNKNPSTTLSIITNLSTDSGSGSENITVPSVIPCNTNHITQKDVGLPSTSATIPTSSQASSIISNLSNNTEGEIMSVPSDNNMSCATNIKRQKELEEQERLRKRYRNKYSYLMKYKNVNKTQITGPKSNDLIIPLKNANKPNNTQNSVNSSTQCTQYCDPVFNGIENVEVAYTQNEDNQNDKFERQLIQFTNVHPRIVLNKFDVDNNFSLRKRQNGITNSHQSNSSVIPDSSNSKNVTLKRRVQRDKQKRKTINNTRNNKKATTKNIKFKHPNKKVFRKQTKTK